MKRILLIVTLLLSLVFPFTAYAELKEYNGFAYAIERFSEGRDDEGRLGAYIYCYVATESNAILEIPNELEGYPVLEIGNGTLSRNYFFERQDIRNAVETVIIPESVEYIHGSFRNCISLKNVIFKGNNLKKISNNSFQGCSSLKEISLSHGIEKIGSRAFKDCIKLESVKLNTRIKEIGLSAFSGCINLKSINIPEGVEIIKTYAFADCDSLEEFTIPSTVYEFGDLPDPAGTEPSDVVYGKNLKKITNLTNIDFEANSKNRNKNWYYNADGTGAEIDYIPANSTVYYVKKTASSGNSGGSSSSGSGGGGGGGSSSKSNKKPTKAEVVTIVLKDTYEGSAWEQKDGIWYLKKADNTYATDWAVKDGEWYYMNPDGTMQTGWKLINNLWYHFANSGAMYKGWSQSNGLWYYTNPVNGEMLTGWQLVDGKWYYLEQTSGRMLTGWQVIDGKHYYMTPSGDMLANTTTPDGYKVDENGVWIQ